MQELYLSKRDIYVRKNEFQTERETIVFIHGLAGSSSAWRRYEEELEKSFNLLSYDLRGHGKSSRHERYEDYHISHFSDDLEYVATHFNLDKFILVAHSFGTFISIDYTLRYKERVLKSVLLAPGFEATTRHLLPLINLSILSTKFMRKTFDLQPKRSHVDYSGSICLGDWNIRRLYADIRNTGLLVYLYCIKQATNVVNNDQVSIINCPVLIIHGKKDTVLHHSGSAKLHKNIKNSKLVLMDKANHVFIFNHIKEITQHISDFIKK